MQLSNLYYLDVNESCLQYFIFFSTYESVQWVRLFVPGKPFPPTVLEHSNSLGLMCYYKENEVCEYSPIRFHIWILSERSSRDKELHTLKRREKWDKNVIKTCIKNGISKETPNVTITSSNICNLIKLGINY